MQSQLAEPQSSNRLELTEDAISQLDLSLNDLKRARKMLKHQRINQKIQAVTGRMRLHPLPLSFTRQDVFRKQKRNNSSELDDMFCERKFKNSGFSIATTVLTNLNDP